MTTATQPALPYPIGIKINVFKDDGNWGNYRAWFMRTDADLRNLSVVTITLAHFEGEDEPAYTAAEWANKAARLVEQYPDCIFIYC